MKALNWSSEFEFAVEGVNFQCFVGDYSGKTSRERFVLLKDRAVLEQYARVLEDVSPKNILEFGIFQGGSPVLFSLWFDADKFVGIDICDPVPAFDEFCREHPVGARIRSYYGISQTDRRRIEEVVRAEFTSAPIDLIIDDASHRYAESKRSFEIAFPLLRPGGIYVIEDWGWAHWRESFASYAGQTPLSRLVMEMVMACATSPHLISEVRVFPTFAFIRKSPEAQPLPDVEVDDLYLKRDLELLGPQHLHLKGVSRLIALHVKQRIHRRLQRTRNKFRRALQRRHASPGQ